MKTLRLCILILLQCSFIPARSQSNRIPFEHIGTAEGLSQSNIFTIIQDKRGFMWFGSWDGLNKYDGYNIIVYKNKPGDSLSLSNNYINQVAEDDKGNLWIATYDGLNYFDRNKEIFKRYRHSTVSANSVRNNNINTVHVDKRGKVWIGTQDGLDSYDPVKNKFEHLDLLRNVENLDAGRGIKYIYEDSRGNLWICNVGNGISILEPNGAVTNLRHTDKPNSLGGNNVNAIFEDSRQRIWLGTNGSGLDLYDEKNNSFRNFKHDDNNPNSIGKNVILAINEDAEQNLWVSTENGGISIFNYDAGSFSTYRHDEINKESISNNAVYCIYRDNKGNMWLGNFAGWVDMAIHDKLLFRHYQHTMSNSSLANNQVLSIMEDKQKKIWIGTDGGGLDLFDPENGNFVHFRHQKNNPTSICGDFVLNTCEDSKGNIWIGTWLDGITVLNPQRKVIKHFKNNPSDPASLSCNNAWKIFEDREKDIWIGTYGGGLDKLNPDGKSFTHYRRSDSNSNGITIENIVNIFEDKEGNLWLCSENKGLNMFVRKKQTFTLFTHNENTNSISDNNINSVFEDSNDNLWIGTMNGLNCYNKKNRHFSVYKKTNGLAGDYVFGILEDEKKNLWISTNNGISRFDPITRAFDNYSITDGVQSNEFKQLAACKSASGIMYFGGINGFNQFFPDSIKRQSFEPPLVITNFTVFNKQVPIELDINQPSPLKQSISETKSVTLPYSACVFAFEFASLNYTGNERKRYSYMLEGFDKKWIEAGMARSATYTNLDPGTYIFKVRGVNNEGKISSNITTVTVVIRPPFWLTWWFKTGIFILAAGFVTVFYRWRLHAIGHQKKELQKQVNEQTRQLQFSAEQEKKARKEAEEAYAATKLANAGLEESEQRYSSLFYQSPQPMWVYDIETLQFAQVNNAAVAQYGYTEEEFLSMTVTDLYPRNQRQQGIPPVVNNGKKWCNGYTGRFRHIKKSGEIIQVEIYSSFIKINDREYRLFTAVDITEKMLFQNKITKAIIKTQEDERYEIGSELHDNVCQILVSSQMNISMLKNSFPKSLNPFYENSKLHIKQALEEIRNLSHRLAPAFFDEMTLEEAFKVLTTSINIDNKYNISLYFYKSVNDKLLNRNIQLNLYRILQEQLRNIVKYSNATDISIDVMVNKKNELVMQTSDDGIGFDVAATKFGIGMSNMKRRAELLSGTIEIDSSPGNGCSITAVIPLNGSASMEM